VVLTLPPSPAENVIVYLAKGAGVEVTGVGVSSEEQDNTNRNIVTMESSFFISL
jgi:cyclopropane fatty-acyl-phospholipid synthase-like methyltransferase